MQSDLHHNIICGVIGRHTRNDLKAFMVFLNRVLDTIGKVKNFKALRNLISKSLESIVNCSLSTGLID